MSDRQEVPTKKACPREMRFNAAVLILLTLGVLQLVFHWAQSYLGFVGGVVFVLLSMFCFEWNVVHGGALTRHKRAYFDVSNVLETYQPRARTMGHLFQPDPPTPGCVTFAAGTPEPDAAKNAAFNNARDSHYANMYENAIKMAQEMEAMEKAAGHPSLDAAPSPSKQLAPADVVKDKKEQDEKKKKETEAYLKSLDKPFKC